MNKAGAPSTKCGRILNICLKLNSWSKAKKYPFKNQSSKGYEKDFKCR